MCLKCALQRNKEIYIYIIIYISENKNITHYNKTKKKKGRLSGTDTADPEVSKPSFIIYVFNRGEIETNPEMWKDLRKSTFRDN